MIGAALERVPRGTTRTALRALEAAGRHVPRTAVTAPLGGRVPILRPRVSRERLAQAVRGRRVLLTGASSGIGRETALALGRPGGSVTLVGRREELLAE